MLRFLSILALLSISCYASGDVYKKTLPDGSVIFSDEPSEGAERVTVKPVQTFPSATSPRPDDARAKTDAQEEKKAVKYTSVAITNPAHDSTIRENSGRLAVEISVQPPLNTAQGDQLTISLNGTHVAGPTDSLALTLENVDRGTHDITAQIRNKQGTVMKQSEPVTFHLLRHSVIRGR